MLDKEQIAKLTATFGAEAAVDAVARDLDYPAAIEALAETQATALADARAELQTTTDALAKANADLAEANAKIQAHANGLVDPLGNHTPPPPKDQQEGEAADAEAKADDAIRAEMDRMVDEARK